MLVVIGEANADFVLTYTLQGSGSEGGEGSETSKETISGTIAENNEYINEEVVIPSDGNYVFSIDVAVEAIILINPNDGSETMVDVGVEVELTAGTYVLVVIGEANADFVLTYTLQSSGSEGGEGEGEHTHSYESVVTNPTCTTAGYTTYTCTSCGDSYIGDEVAALGHTEVVDAAVAPDCTNTGLTEGKHCSVCEEVIVAQTEVAALGHTYIEGYCSCGAEDPDYYFEMSISDALSAADGKNVIVSGTVSTINTAWSDSFGNISVTITDADGNSLYVYRLETNVALGDVITVTGTMSTYNDARQIAEGATAEITGHDSSYDYVEVTIPEARELEDNANVIVTGTVVVIDTAYNSSYNNISVYIADDNGNRLYIYRLTGDVALNSIITVKGSMATYGGDRQITGGTFELVGTHSCSNYTEATCEAPKACIVCGATDGDVIDHIYENGVCTMCGKEEGAAEIETEDLKYTFSDYTAGTQYAENEEHVLDGNTTMTTNKAHFTSDLRLYSSSTNDATAVIYSIQQVNKIAVNAGNKVDVLNVYACNDGSTWVLVGTISVTSTSYNDYELDLCGAYNYIKLDVAGSNQIRIKTMTLTVIKNNCAHENTTTTTENATCDTAGFTNVVCEDCKMTVSSTPIPATGHSYNDGVVTTPATCGQAGVKTYTCSLCSGTKTETIEATGEHSYSDGTCTVCGATESAGSVTEMSVSKSHTDIATIAGVSTSGGSINGTTIKLDDNISIVCAKGDSTSNPAIYSESIRLYQNGATLTVKAAEGCEMTTIVITLATKSGGQGPITVTGGTASDLANYTYTITVSEGVSEVVITTAGTTSSTRLYVSNIEVNYTK